MLDVSAAQDRAAALIDRARRAGADAADAVYLADASESVGVRLGKLEDLERSESEHVSLRVFAGKGSASIGTSDLTDAALDELAARAVAMARAAPEDPYAALAPEDMLARGSLPELELSDPVVRSPAELRAAAEAIEAAALAVPGVTNSQGGSASVGRTIVALATSHGFVGGYQATSHGLSASVVAGEGSGMQRDYAWRSARHLDDLPGADEVGTLAGRRAVHRLAPGRLSSGQMPVVFDPRVGGTLVSHLVSAMSGSAIARRASFLLDHDGEQLFPEAISIVDEPLRLRGLRSKPFDGEGLPTASRVLVENGRLNGWLMNAAAARQLGGRPTGHATRGGGAPGIGSTNTHLAAGPVSPAELVADIADGVYVTELIGQGVNGVTGDYSRGASGVRIVNGEFAGPVAEFTIAGNLLEMFRTLRAAD
ncbi:MAG TPA: metallopeptidase TldD-related protein, partial [Novosphingobium sp.]|nr:metallopeptidase TldD-related protein [Novosphingobium sp.]